MKLNAISSKFSMQLSCSLTFSILYCLGFHPITCHILVNNLHFITSKLMKSHFAFTVWSCHATEAGEMLCDKTKQWL